MPIMSKNQTTTVLTSRDTWRPNRISRHILALYNVGCPGSPPATQATGRTGYRDSGALGPLPPPTITEWAPPTDCGKKVYHEITEGTEGSRSALVSQCRGSTSSSPHFPPGAVSGPSEWEISVFLNLSPSTLSRLCEVALHFSTLEYRYLGRRSCCSCLATLRVASQPSADSLVNGTTKTGASSDARSVEI